MENLRFRGRLMLLEQECGRDSCWIYPGKPHSNGYCIVHVTYKDGSHHKMMAHKLAYLMLRGAYPAELELDHLCRTPRCCNPWHLEPVTRLENWRRGESISAMRARQTHCKNGHPFSGDNLILCTNWNGRAARKCRTCWNAKMRNRRKLFGEEMRTQARAQYPLTYQRYQQRHGITPRTPQPLMFRNKSIRLSVFAKLIHQLPSTIIYHLRRGRTLEQIYERFHK